MKSIPLGGLFAERVSTIDPRQFPEEQFELWSIPAYDLDVPQTSKGATIGSAKKCIFPSDVLLSRIVPHIRRAWIVSASRGNRQIGSGEWIVFRNTIVAPEYLRQFLLSDLFHVQFMQTVAGVGGSLVRARPEGVAKILIPIPPLDEQRRLAGILNKADALRRKRQETLALLDNLDDAIFAAMFVRGEHTDWPLRRVEEIAINVRTGPFGSQLLHSEFVEDGIAVLGIDNAVSNEFRWDQRRFITTEKYRSLRRYTVRPGDVLITIMGTCGRCAIVPDDIPAAINTKHLCCLTLDHTVVLPTFLRASFLQHPSVLKQLGVRAKGAVMPGLNMGIIKSLELRIPPIDLQSAFAARIEAVTKLRTSSRNHRDQLEDLFESLQQGVFRGELTSGDVGRELELAG